VHKAGQAFSVNDATVSRLVQMRSTRRISVGLLELESKLTNSVCRDDVVLVGYAAV
jgi:hypothetical protein